MSLAVAVYATHVNWRERVLRTPEETAADEEVGYKVQLEQARTRHQELKDQKDRLEGEVAAERRRFDVAGQLATLARSLAMRLSDVQLRKRAIDTDTRFVVCPNLLGGCYGTTGPRFPDPDGEPWLDRFPLLTPLDMMRAQRAFLGALAACIRRP